VVSQKSKLKINYFCSLAIGIRAHRSHYTYTAADHTLIITIYTISQCGRLRVLGVQNVVFTLNIIHRQRRRLTAVSEKKTHFGLESAEDARHVYGHVGRYAIICVVCTSHIIGSRGDGSRCGRTEQTTWRLQWRRRWRSIWAFTHKPLGSSAVGEAWPRAVFITII